MSVASVALLALAPVLVASAIAVKATSQGPVFFRQTRVGLEGRPFEMLKFRLTHSHAEARRAKLLADSDREVDSFKMRNAPPSSRLVGLFGATPSMSCRRF